jgi:hypothetical protein
MHNRFAQFVQAHSASVIKAVREKDAAEKKSDFMKHYKLVNKIGSGVIQ